MKESKKEYKFYYDKSFWQFICLPLNLFVFKDYNWKLHLLLYITYNSYLSVSDIHLS